MDLHAGSATGRAQSVAERSSGSSAARAFAAQCSRTRPIGRASVSDRITLKVRKSGSLSGTSTAAL